MSVSLRWDGQWMVGERKMNMKEYWKSERIRIGACRDRTVDKYALGGNAVVQSRWSGWIKVAQ